MAIEKFNPADWEFENSSGFCGYRNKATKEWMCSYEYGRKTVNYERKEKLLKHPTHVIVDTLKVEDMGCEDGGKFLDFSVNNTPDEDNGMYVRICSWDDTKKHEELQKFIGKKVRVTIRVI